MPALEQVARRRAIASLATGAALLLASCGADEETRLRQWMAAQVAAAMPSPRGAQERELEGDVKGGVKVGLDGGLDGGLEEGWAADLESAPAMPPMAQGAVDVAADPFSATRLGARRFEQAGPPETPPCRDPLEAYPLDGVAMVGVLRAGPDVRGVVRAGGELHAVAVGQRLGQQGGRIVRIDDEAIVLHLRSGAGAGSGSEPGSASGPAEEVAAVLRLGDGS